MTKREAAEKIIAADGDCTEILCDDCPAAEDGIYGKYCLVSLISSVCKVWFGRWLKENPMDSGD